MTLVWYPCTTCDTLSPPSAVWHIPGGVQCHRCVREGFETCERVFGPRGRGATQP